MKRPLLRRSRLLDRATGFRTVVAGSIAVATLLTGCVGRHGNAPGLIAFGPDALAAALHTALDTFAATNAVSVAQENGGSLTAVRKLTELGRAPDVVALADTALFGRVLVPRYVAAGEVRAIATTRMVLAYTPRSRFAAEITPANWFSVVQRPGVETGRADPATDPGGYRALMTLQLAERYYGMPGLAARLAAAIPTRDIRPTAADLVALLQTGNLDYAWEYESVARAAGLRFVTLPPEINLGDPARAAAYVAAVVRVPGASRGDTLVLRGAPIVFGVAMPRHAAHERAARGFITFLLSARGTAILRAAYFEPTGTNDGADTR